MFDYTQSKFWGGAWYPYWTLILMTVIFGFFGLDHLWLRSPTTSLLKFIINIFTLGSWYFYDILQIFGERESVMKNGLSAPFAGPLGIGAGVFVDNNPTGDKSNREPYKFMLYSLLVWLPFGIDLLVAGDIDGAIIKFILTISIIGFPMVLCWSLVNYIYLITKPKEFFTTGNYHMFPLNSLIGEYGSSILGPRDIIIDSELTVDKIKGKVKGIPVAGTYVAVLDSAEKAAGTLSKIAGAIDKLPPEQLIEKIILPEIKQLSSPNSAPVTKHAVAGAADAIKTIQKGGGLDSNISETALLILFVIILGGGTISAANRMGLNSYLFNKQKENDNDTPPEP
jgi:hypothetical protein